MNRCRQGWVLGAMALFAVASCVSRNQGVDVVSSQEDRHYRLSSSTTVLVTSEAGDKIATQPNVDFQDGRAGGVRVTVHPEATRQTVTGIGSSFTESSAFVLAHLDPATRHEVMENIYGENGANFSMARTTMGAREFSVGGKYSYADGPGEVKV